MNKYLVVSYDGETQRRALHQVVAISPTEATKFIEGKTNSKWAWVFTIDDLAFELNWLTVRSIDTIRKEMENIK